MVYNDLQKELILTFRHILYKGVVASGTLSRFVSLNRFLNSNNDDLFGVSNFCCCLWIFFIAWNRPPRKPNPYLKQILNFGHNVKTMTLYCTTQPFLLATKLDFYPITSVVPAVATQDVKLTPGFVNALTCCSSRLWTVVICTAWKKNRGTNSAWELQFNPKGGARKKGFFKTMNNFHLQNMKEKRREHIQLVRYSLNFNPRGSRKNGYETNHARECLML